MLVVIAPKEPWWIWILLQVCVNPGLPVLISNQRWSRLSSYFKPHSSVGQNQSSSSESKAVWTSPQHLPLRPTNLHGTTTLRKVAFARFSWNIPANSSSSRYYLHHRAGLCWRHLINTRAAGFCVLEWQTTCCLLFLSSVIPILPGCLI